MMQRPADATVTDTLLPAALDAVHEAAQAARQAWIARDLRSVEKSPNDWLTHLDLLVDQSIDTSLRRRLGTLALISEERDNLPADALPDAFWILDPIDGTRNAILGIPYFAISLAFVVEGVVQLGVTCNVATGDTCHAARGHGLRLNGERVAAPSGAPVPLASAVVSTGFPHDKQLRPRHVELVRWLVQACSDIRRFASPTLDLCLLATGRLHGVVEMLKPWDVAAGSLFLDEQGLPHNLGGSLQRRHFDPRTYFVAGTPGVFPALQAAVGELGEQAQA
jgi:myo-inositol-1(or 4)-monophosphatase